MGKVLSRENMLAAWKEVKANKGAPGVDGRDFEATWEHLKTNWETIREELQNGTYRPKPVLRVTIPKRDGGTRQLGIPTITDRLIQQSVARVIRPAMEAQFSDHSYGFRPGRNAHQAVARAAQYYDEGYHWVVDIDLKSYFDTINHDLLLIRLREVIKDERIVKLINRYLKAGVLEGGKVHATVSGSPQGGNLSPLLANLYLTEFDRELERRGHRFVRYADDVNIYAKSERGAKRIMESATRYLEKKLKLTVNQEKSQVGDPTELKFLGFTLGNREADERRRAEQKKQQKRKRLKGKLPPSGESSEAETPRPQHDKTTIRIHPRSQERFRYEVRRRTKRRSGRSLADTLERLAKFTVGWLGYYARAEMEWWIGRASRWIRRRIRAIALAQWATPVNVYHKLRASGVRHTLAWVCSRSLKGVWHTSHKMGNACLRNRLLESWGYDDILVRYRKLHNYR